MSLVDVQPSTVMPLKESRTATRNRSAKAAGSTAASVVRKASMVAMSGASIPAPLAIPATRKVGFSTSTSFGPESVVRIPTAASCAERADAERDATRAGMPGPGSMGRVMPIRPVEQTRMCCTGTSSPAATSSHMWWRRLDREHRLPRWHCRCSPPRRPPSRRWRPGGRDSPGPARRRPGWW